MSRSIGIAGILLAAGGSSRFDGDGPKQLVDFGGEPLVRRVARAMVDARLSPVVAVVGHRAGEVRAALAGLNVRIVENRDWAAGQAGSVRAGVAAVPPSCRAACFVPCDQPFLDSATLGRLLERSELEPDLVVVPTYAGRRGAPVIFPRDDFDALAALEGDEGGRALLRESPDRVCEVALASELPLRDVDTADDLRRLRRRL